MENGRVVSYLYRYKDNVKYENSGFVKLNQLSEGKCRFHINIKDYVKKDRPNCNVYLFRKSDEGNFIAKQLDDISVAAGLGELKRVYSDNILGRGNVCSSLFDGILITYSDNEQICSTWKEYTISPQSIIKSIYLMQDDKKEQSVISEQEDSSSMTKNISNVAEQNINSTMAKTINPSIKQNVSNQAEKNMSSSAEDVEPQSIKEASITADKPNTQSVCEKMLDEYPGLPHFGNNQIIKGVKLEPKDIGKLDMANWRLGVNSFLSHGYYNYKYIMLGKIEFVEKEFRYVIGVPGVYNNKQKYLANMFGFDVFIPVNRTNVLTGAFGYWVMEIVNT